jgi:hypothetical protein
MRDKRDLKSRRKDQTKSTPSPWQILLKPASNRGFNNLQIPFESYPVSFTPCFSEPVSPVELNRAGELRMGVKEDLAAAF